ncbi:hypothetical protein CPB85DRAFT_1443947 [Mucidula mucida]|nr:hypothetical protein CPB85DRAFT_1443947 [Mucidula mucida]
MSTNKNSYPTRQTTVKREEAEAVAIKVSSTTSPEPATAHGTSWSHPAELAYPDAAAWTTDSIMEYIITYSFSVPGRNVTGKRSYFSTIMSADGTTTTIPSVYRIPLMFVANFLWRSVYLVLQAGEWEDFKLGILHVGRVANAFLLEAREEAGQKGIGKMWRSEMFNRVLVRYRMGWLISDPKQLKEFWDLYGENEYRKDTIKTLEWTRIALKGHKGFSITEEQIEDGISIAQFMDGLKENEGKWLWDPSGQNSPGTSAYQSLEQWRATRTWRAGQVPSTGAAITAANKQDTAMAPPPPPSPTKVVSPLPPPTAAPILPTPVTSTCPPLTTTRPLSLLNVSHPSVSRPTTQYTYPQPPPPSAAPPLEQSLSYSTPKSSVPFVFDALQQREQHIETLERKLAALKRRLDYEEVYGAPMEGVEEPGMGTGFWRSNLEHLTAEPGEQAPGLTRTQSTPVKSRRKPSHMMDTSL